MDPKHPLWASALVLSQILVWIGVPAVAIGLLLSGYTTFGGTMAIWWVATFGLPCVVGYITLGGGMGAVDRLHAMSEEETMIHVQRNQNISYMIVMSAGGLVLAAIYIL
jgi:hypothetical protein